MNIEFTHINNKAFISDEYGNKKVVSYYDNLYNVLSKENMIELIEKEIEKTNKEKFKLDYITPNHYIPVCVHTSLAAICISTLIIKLGGVIPDHIIMQTRLVTFTNVEFIPFLSAVLSLPLFSIYDILSYKKNKKYNNNKYANEVEMEYLKKELNILKEELEILKKNKTNSIIQKENECENVNLTSNPSIENFINDIVKLYYQLGYNEKQLYKLYLNNKLNSVFEGNNLDLATKYFEEKGPILSRKYKYNKKKLHK